jgi:CHAT domain-containing protein
LRFDQIKENLDPETLTIFYTINESETHVFALTPGLPLHHVTLTITQSELRSRVDLLNETIARTLYSPTLTALREKNLLSASSQLFNILLRPLGDLLDQRSRILIIPDGPLHLLPWGMLVVKPLGQPDDARDYRRQWRYLAEVKPVHIALSFTTYFELQKLRRQAANGGHEDTAPFFVGFGDPHFPSSSSKIAEPITFVPEPRIRSLVERGFQFSSLPASRQEVEGIVELYPKVSNAYFGIEASEERAKAIPESTRIIHFATHATLDHRFPLNSAVVLSIPAKFEVGRDNGLLQAWEIFERVRLNADLVVLSACESGLGKEMGGEGLIGLTRAFHYAGARSVMASLWKISDRTTAEFMVRFYRHLKDGLSKDEALRATQMEFIRGPIQVTNDKGERVKFDASAPYYWAAFQIYGDWQ